MEQPIERREFLALTVGAIAAGALSGCAANPAQPGANPPSSDQIDAGPAADYANDGVYTAFADRGFFIVRREGELLALSSLCTHRTCHLRAEPDKSFFCPCHGSRFDSTGQVTRSPATRDLPRYATRIDDRGHLIVTP